ncbi:major facilitator superfamily transporter [Ligilactobacillus salitolerans]|uniref:Major facilitator superfamily transporter n=1 Tax=Ligilactobacillus salitolerans TaxID=1808352 RepID=A0A401IRT7_9LACO|nr:MFS transporter [Ligilactobacillus salitolerans]GBG94215.1 major facilitator superfamily transporter [Ligilactobacillus salitolerans]
MKLKMQQLPLWRQNLYVLWFGVFMTGMGMSEIMPFLSLFIAELGDFSKEQLSLYSGLIFAVTFLVMAIVSPLWGKLADQKGRKLMLLRASIGMCIVIFLMGFVTNIWELLLLRALQGAFGGYVSNSNALVAAQTPRQHSGHALSILVTGITAGNLLGPLLGGFLADAFSYRTSFHITGVIMFLVFLLTWVFVHEKQQEQPAQKQTVTKTLTFTDIRKNKVILLLLTTTLLVQVVTMSINPILSLFVKQLLDPGQSVTMMAGLVASMPGISTVIAAPAFGKLGDRIGTHKLLIFGFVFAMVVFAATTFVTNVYLLMFLRLLTGVSDAALLPVIQTLLTKNTAPENTSLVFSYNQSFQSLGNMCGPLFGSAIAAIFNYRGIFAFCSLIMLINFVSFTRSKLFVSNEK